MAPRTGLFIGIGASLGLLGVIGLIVFAVLYHRDYIGDPVVTAAPGMLDKIDINIDLSKFTTPPPATGKDADADYQAAVKEIAAQGDDFAQNVKDTVESPGEPEKNPVFKSIMEKIEAAADKGLADSENLDFDASLPLTPSTEWTVPRSIFDKLDGVRKLMSRSAMMMQDAKDPAHAEKRLRAELLWGMRLYKNGTFVVYKSAGQAAISDALGLFKREYSPDFSKDPAKAAAAESSYNDIYLPAAKTWTKKEYILRTVKPGPAPGDIWNLAENDKDRAWNIEGILWLGIAQWTWSEGNQRKAIQKYLEQKSASPDPLIAKFAKAAAATPRAGAGDFGR